MLKCRTLSLLSDVFIQKKLSKSIYVSVKIFKPQRNFVSIVLDKKFGSSQNYNNLFGHPPNTMITKVHYVLKMAIVVSIVVCRY